jgi:hypothetical protein
MESSACRPGIWEDHWTKEIYTGSSLLKNYSTPLEVLPFFERFGG